jgi:putative transposase
MARKPRLEVEPGVFHVYARGNEKQDIFRSDDDRAGYVRRLVSVVGWGRWRCLSYCLMGNHVHLLIETTTPNLGQGMQRLHGGYAQVFNHRYGRCGHLFQGRYGAVRVTSDAQLATTVAYIATNPVSAGVVDLAEAWPWSSHRAMAGDATAPWLARERLWELLEAAFGGDGRRRYRRLVAERLEAAGVTVSTSDTSTGAGSGSVVR